MKIGIDVSRYFDLSGGIGIYAYNLLKNLIKIDDKNSYTAYSYFYDCFPSNWKDKKTISDFNNPNLEFSQINLTMRQLKRKWNNSSIEDKEEILGNVDLIHSTAYMIPEFFNTKLVVTVHDLSFLIFPQYHTKENYGLVLKNLIYLNSRPDMVICDSEQTKKDVKKFFHVPEEKLKVIYLGVDEKFGKDIREEKIEEALKKYNIDFDYILCVSSIEPRKNFERIIEAFSHLIKNEKYKNLNLVCVGGRGWKNTEIYKKVKEKNIEEKVKFLGFVPEDEVPFIYRKAKLFLYPSLYEGFGLPILEAMASGVPVITSNISSMPEVSGDAAIMVNPYNEEEIFKASLSLLEKEYKRKELIEKGYKNIKNFSWEKTAKKTLEIYENL